MKINVHLSDNIFPTKLCSRELKLCVQTLNRKRRAKNVTKGQGAMIINFDVSKLHCVTNVLT